MNDVLCKVLSADEFQSLLNEIYGTAVYAEYSSDGLYIDQPIDDEGPVEISDLHERLAARLDVDEVTSIHIDDCEPTGVWIAFRNRDIIKRIEMDLREWATSLPTGAIAYDIRYEVIDSEYCDTEEEFKAFIDEHRSSIDEDTELIFIYNAADLDALVPVMRSIRAYFNYVHN